jgi:hypothetical protein
MDRTLDRLVRFDERSRNYPVRAALPTKPPRSYTWRCRHWYDQGREGACVAYSLAHEASARPRELLVPIPTQTIRNWYHDAQRIDPWPGGAYPGATPQYEGTSVLAGAQIGVRSKLFTGYRWCFGLDDLILALGYAGPVILGINWYEGMFAPTADGQVKVGGDVAGGHAILARGVSVKNRRILLRNSWGRSFGVDGDCWLSFDDADRLLHEDGEAMVPVGRQRLWSKLSLMF